MPKMTDAILSKIKDALNVDNFEMINPLSRVESELSRDYLLQLIDTHHKDLDVLHNALNRFFRIRLAGQMNNEVLGPVLRILTKANILTLDNFTQEEKISGTMLKCMMDDYIVEELREGLGTPLKTLTGFSYADLIKDELTTIPALFQHTDKNLTNKYAETTLLEHALKNKMSEFLLTLMPTEADFAKAFELSSNDKDMMMFLVKTWEGSLSYKSNVGDTILHLAARNNWCEIAALTIKKDKSLIDALNSNNSTPLHIAAKNAHLDIVKLLLDAEANANLENKDHNTALSLATGQNTEAGYIEIVSSLLNKMTPESVNCMAEKNRSALAWAVLKKHRSIVQLLVSFNGIHVSEKNSENNTILHIAALRNWFDIAVLALEKDKTLIDELNSNNSTPLHIAAQNAHVDIVKLLLDAGANANLASKDQNTALSLATGQNTEAGYIEIVSSLLKKMTPESVNCIAEKNRSALAWAVAKGHAEIVRLIVLYPPSDISETYNEKRDKGDLSLEQIARKENWAGVVQAINEHANTLRFFKLEKCCNELSQTVETLRHELAAVKNDIYKSTVERPLLWYSQHKVKQVEHNEKAGAATFFSPN